MRKLFFVMFFSLTMVGCSKGLDRKLDNSSNEAFNKSIEIIVNEASPEEKAVIAEHYEDIVFATLGAAFNGRDPGFGGETGRELFSSWLNQLISRQDTYISNLKKRQEFALPLKDIKFDEPVYIKESKDFFHNGHPEVRLTISNDSNFKISKMQIRTRIYVDDELTHEAESKNFLTFSNGLEPGQKITEIYYPGGMGNRDGWDKLSIKKANSQRIGVYLISITDYQDNEIERISDYKIKDAESKADHLKKQLAIIKKT